MKEKQKELRKAAYRQAKERHREMDKTKHSDIDDDVQSPQQISLAPDPEKEQKERALWEKIKPAAKLSPPKLRLIKNTETWTD